MFNQFDPTVQATIKFLHLLNVKVNSTTVNSSLQNHPDWPSLLCISDTLTKWNVSNGAVSINPNHLERLPTPFLARTNDEGAPLVVVTDVTAEQITLYNGNFRRARTTSKSNFIDNWDGIYLIAEPEPEAGEPDYVRNKNLELYRRLLPVSAAMVLVGLCAVFAHNLVSRLDNGVGFRWVGIYVQLLILLTGIAVTTALVWYDIDKNNPLLKRVCTNLIKSDCNAILTGEHSKVFSWLSWSEVGLFYFTGGLLTLILGGSQITSVVGFIAWMNVLALPYTFFSVYYQWQVAKQWCAMCLIVQALLLLGGFNALINNLILPLPNINTIEIAIIISLYLFPVLIWYSIKPFVLQMHEGKETERQYRRLKFNSELFIALLKNQKSIISTVDHLGITLGSPNANHTLIKVCSTYCGPCSKAHPEISRLLETHSDLQVRIIFLAPNPKFNTAVKPIQHLLAIAEQGDPGKLHQALDDWYLSGDKDYDRFAARFPVDQDSLQQQEHIVAMNAWCEQEGIRSTPTLFLNGYQLPNSHSVKDLHYLLLDLPVLAHQMN